MRAYVSSYTNNIADYLFLCNRLQKKINKKLPIVQTNEGSRLKLIL